MEETKEAATAQSFNEICKILSECQSPNEAAEFLACLCTPAEREDFSKRWLSVKELYKGTPQREIAKKFNMSLCKITRGSKELRKENSAFKKILDKSQN
ncbi:MAG: trp operon repressor [Treponema sp.]|nr:trp operon repressor [Treponema sp.]